MAAVSLAVRSNGVDARCFLRGNAAEFRARTRHRRRRPTDTANTVVQIGDAVAAADERLLSAALGGELRADARRVAARFFLAAPTHGALDVLRAFVELGEHDGLGAARRQDAESDERGENLHGHMNAR